MQWKNSSQASHKWLWNLHKKYTKKHSSAAEKICILFHHLFFTAKKKKNKFTNPFFFIGSISFSDILLIGQKYSLLVIKNHYAINSLQPPVWLGIFLKYFNTLLNMEMTNAHILTEIWVVRLSYFWKHSTTKFSTDFLPTSRSRFTANLNSPRNSQVVKFKI